jgi:hypothetical protein
MGEMFQPYDFAYLLLDGSSPVLLSIPLKFPLAVEKESEKEVLIVGLLLLQAVLANG